MILGRGNTTRGTCAFGGGGTRTAVACFGAAGLSVAIACAFDEELLPAASSESCFSRIVLGRFLGSAPSHAWRLVRMCNTFCIALEGFAGTLEGLMLRERVSFLRCFCCRRKGTLPFLAWRTLAVKRGKLISVMNLPGLVAGVPTAWPGKARNLFPAGYGREALRGKPATGVVGKRGR